MPTKSVKSVNYILLAVATFSWAMWYWYFYIANPQGAGSGLILLNPINLALYLILPIAGFVSTLLLFFGGLKQRREDHSNIGLLLAIVAAIGFIVPAWFAVQTFVL